MDRTVASLNVQHFKHLLETETDPEKRATIMRLLAEEQAKIKSLQKHEPNTGDAA